MQNLEDRIAAALNGGAPTSAELGELLGETEAAIPIAVAAAAEARARLVNPALPADARTKAAAERAALTVERLQASLPPLQKSCQSAYAREQMDAYMPRYNAAAARQAELAAALEALYRPFVEQAVRLLAQIEQHDREIALLNLNSPPEAPHLRSVEETARGLARGGELSICRDLKLPSWEPSGAPAYPPFRGLDPSVIAPMAGGNPNAFTADWWKTPERVEG